MTDTSAPLRLMSDYWCVMPLWSSRGCIRDTTALGLSDSLRDDLLAWQSEFEHHYHFERGWDDPKTAARYGLEGESLLRRLREELPGRVISLDL